MKSGILGLFSTPASSSKQNASGKRWKVLSGIRKSFGEVEISISVITVAALARGVARAHTAETRGGYSSAGFFRLELPHSTS
jgi:hypothetical protein